MTNLVFGPSEGWLRADKILRSNLSFISSQESLCIKQDFRNNGNLSNCHSCFIDSTVAVAAALALSIFSINGSFSE